MNKTQIKILQVGALTAGSIFAWYNNAKAFVDFYNLEGTLWKFSDCDIPNPLITACFYGGIAFILALIWTGKLQDFSGEKLKKNLKNLVYFLIAGSIFAWSNFAYEAYKLAKAAGAPIVGCTGPIQSLWESPCLYGAILFTLSLIFTYLWKREEDQ